MPGMIDLVCQACHRKFGFAYMSYTAHRDVPCPHCRKVGITRKSLQKIYDQVRDTRRSITKEPKHKGRRAKS